MIHQIVAVFHKSMKAVSNIFIIFYFLTAIIENAWRCLVEKDKRHKINNLNFEEYGLVKQREHILLNGEGFLCE